MNEEKAGKNLTIAIGSDHAGYSLKQELSDKLRGRGYRVQDFGAFSTESVDYPDIAREVATAIASGEYDRGILICGTGVGMTITANKVRGIRATACSEPYSAKMARAHNNANIIGIGSRVVGLGLALEIAVAFIETQFESGSRHERRVEKIMALEARGEEICASD
jgi:ribose 5-phosphate isomerase B